MLELVEISVSTLWAESAVATVALVEHVAILTILITAGLLLAHASRQFQLLVGFPFAGSISNKNV